MENGIKTKFNGQFEVDETYENNNWLKVKIKTFAFGKNRNGSDILNSSMSDFNNAKTTIGGIPIVAKYNEEKDDLEGHNVILRKNKNDEYEFYHDTNALGFTSPFTKFYFEEINEGTDESPDYKTYVVVEDVYLWKRYDSTKKIMEWFNEGVIPRVSMEIDNVAGQFDNDGYFQISDFDFTAIAALGSDVEPCFPKAEIHTYSVSEFKDDLKQLMSELGFNLSEQKGGNTVTETQVNETEVVEDSVVDETVETTEETTEFENEETTKTTEQAEESTETEVTDESPTTDFELTANQLRDQLRGELSKHTHIDRWGDNCRKYYLVDNTSTHVIVENVQDNYQLYQAPFTLNGDIVTVDFEQAIKVKIEYVPFEGESFEFASKFERFETEKESFVSELDELRVFKRKVEENNLRAKFESQLDNDELDSIILNNESKSFNEIESLIFAEIGKKNFSLKKEEVDTVKVSVNYEKQNEEVKNNPYGSFFD